VAQLDEVVAERRAEGRQRRQRRPKLPRLHLAAARPPTQARGQGPWPRARVLTHGGLSRFTAESLYFSRIECRIPNSGLAH
jgi:hypothetical protein